MAAPSVSPGSQQPSAASAPPVVAVVVFARLPRPGAAIKTRLAASVGPESAVQFYKLCAEHTFAEVARCSSSSSSSGRGAIDVRSSVACAAAEDVAGVAAWLAACGTPMPVRPQLQDPDLGRRMLAALTEAAHCAAAAAAATPQQQQAGGSTDPPQQQQHIQQPSCQAVLVIGTDIPDLSAEVVAGAAAALLGGPRHAAAGDGGAEAGGPAPQAPTAPTEAAAAPPDVVFGPAADGGFYLLGISMQALRQPQVQAGAAFQGVAWSSPDTLARSFATCRAAGLRCAPLDSLPRLRDIDTLQDACEWLACAGGAEGGAAAGSPLRQLLRDMVAEHAGGGGGGTAVAGGGGGNI